jgi:ribosomal-protein-alanine N-acetyltransferase
MFREKFINPTETVLRPASRDDRNSLASLVHFETYVHRHMDYRPPLECVGKLPFSVLEKRGEILGALACPPDPPKIAWIRLFACAHQISPERVWGMLWPEALAQLEQAPDVQWAAAIPIQSWFERLVKQSHFEKTHHIVLLRWESQKLPEKPPKESPATIRPMTLDDMSGVQTVDQASFIPIWQNSQDYLEIAFRQASIATVAEHEGRLVGYQISTSTPMGGHLARLAVAPDFQGHGVGYNLLYDLLKQFYRRGARAVTVNTQHNNLASMSLYERIGFKQTGETYPIYQFPLRSSRE